MPLETDAYLPQQPDPIFDAYRAAFPYRENQLRTDTEARRKKAQDTYNNGLQDLASSVVKSRSNTLAGLESRGVLNSGETQTRLAEITSREDLARARAAAALLQEQQQADTDLQNQLAAMYADYNAQAAAAREREWQNALQIWYAAQAGKKPPPTVRPGPVAPSSHAPPQPTLAQIAAAMRPTASPYIPGKKGPQ